MRKALDKIAQLYSTSPVFQDLLETAAGTGVAAGGQALMTDMTPEEIAIASAAGFGAGMVGRPIVGRAGQTIGGFVDRKHPEMSKIIAEAIEEGVEQLPAGLKEMSRAKVAPYQHMGGVSQYLNMVGRGYGDNLAQLGVALAAPGIFGEEQ